MSPSESETGDSESNDSVLISVPFNQPAHPLQTSDLSRSVKLLSGVTASAVALSYFQQALSLIAVLRKTMPEPLAISITGVAAIVSGSVNGVLAYGQFISLAKQLYEIYSNNGVTGKITALLLLGVLCATTYLAGIPGNITSGGAALYSAQQVLHAPVVIQRALAFLGLIPEGILLSKEIMGLTITLFQKANYRFFNGSIHVYQAELEAYITEQKALLTLETKESYEALAARYCRILTTLENNHAQGIKDLKRLHNECFWKKHWTPEKLVGLFGATLMTKLNIDELTKLEKTGELAQSIGPYAMAFDNFFIKVLVSGLTNLTLFSGIMAEGLRKLRANLVAIYSVDFHSDRNAIRMHQLEDDNSDYNHEHYNARFPILEPQTRREIITKTSTALLLDAGALGPGIGSMAEAGTLTSNTGVMTIGAVGAINSNASLSIADGLYKGGQWFARGVSTLFSSCLSYRGLDDLSRGLLSNEEADLPAEPEESVILQYP